MYILYVRAHASPTHTRRSERVNCRKRAPRASNEYRARRSLYPNDGGEHDHSNSISMIPHTNDGGKHNHPNLIGFGEYGVCEARSLSSNDGGEGGKDELSVKKGAGAYPSVRNCPFWKR